MGALVLNVTDVVVTDDTYTLTAAEPATVVSTEVAVIIGADVNASENVYVPSEAAVSVTAPTSCVISASCTSSMTG
jgi:hypothetical protein